MATVVDTLAILLKIDGGKVDKELTDVVSKVKTSLTNMMTNIVAPAVAGLASGELIQNFTNEIMEVDRLSKSLGVNMEQLQGWQGAAEAAGVAGEEIGELFADLNDWMIDSKLNDSGAMNDFIKQGLLPSVVDAQGEMKKTEQYALELADAFQKMDTQSATGIGRQIGISQNAMVAFLQQGSTTINSQIQHVKDLGTYTKDDAKAAAEFTRVTNDLFRMLKMSLLPVYRAVIPLLLKFVDGINYAKEHVEVFIPLGVALAAVLGVRLLGALKDLALVAKAFLLSPWGIAITALTAIGLILEDFLVWLDGGESAFGRFYESIFGSQEEAQKKVDSFVKFFEEAWNGIKVIVSDVGSFISKYLPQALSVLGNAIMITISVIKTFYSILELAKAIYDYFIDNSEDTGNRVSQAFSNLSNNIGEYFTNIAGFISSCWNLIAPIFGASQVSADNMISSFLSLKNSVVKFFGDMLDSILGFWNKVSPIFSKIGSFFGGPANVELALQGGGTIGDTDNSTHTANVTNNVTINGAQDPQTTGKAVAKFTSDAVSNANNAY